jgi:hypothetical protein
MEHPPPLQVPSPADPAFDGADAERGEGLNVHGLTRLLGSLAIASILVCGCNDPAAQQHLARRSDNLRRTGQNLAEIETNASTHLRNTLDDLREQNDRDIANTRENPGRIDRWVQEDVKRFHDSQPAYRREIEKQLGGNPESIKQTIPDIIY